MATPKLWPQTPPPPTKRGAFPHRATNQKCPTHALAASFRPDPQQHSLAIPSQTSHPRPPDRYPPHNKLAFPKMPHSPSSTATTPSLEQPLKPILKQSLKPSSSYKNPLKPPLTPAPPPKTRQGDPLWLRIMQTKEHQWRLINTIALHELNLLERSACAQLDSLAAQLDSLITQTSQLDALARRCRALRARQNFLAVASDPLRNAVRLLLRLQYTKVRDALVESTCALEVNAPGIDKEVTRFAEAAKRFGEAANLKGLDDLVAIAALLEEIASAAAKEAGAVSCAAQAVVDAATATERRRLDIVENFVDVASTAFVPEPSFIE